MPRNIPEEDTFFEVDLNSDDSPEEDTFFEVDLNSDDSKDKLSLYDDGAEYELSLTEHVEEYGQARDFLATLNLTAPETQKFNTLLTAYYNTLVLNGTIEVNGFSPNETIPEPHLIELDNAYQKLSQAYRPFLTPTYLVATKVVETYLNTALRPSIKSEILVSTLQSYIIEYNGIDLNATLNNTEKQEYKQQVAINMVLCLHDCEQTNTGLATIVQQQAQKTFGATLWHALKTLAKLICPVQLQANDNDMNSPSPSERDTDDDRSDPNVTEPQTYEDKKRQIRFTCQRTQFSKQRDKILPDVERSQIPALEQKRNLQKRNLKRATA